MSALHTPLRSRGDSHTHLHRGHMEFRIPKARKPLEGKGKAFTLGFASSFTVSISSSEMMSRKRTMRGLSHSSSCLTGPRMYLGFLFPS